MRLRTALILMSYSKAPAITLRRGGGGAYINRERGGDGGGEGERGGGCQIDSLSLLAARRCESCPGPVRRPRRKHRPLGSIRARPEKRGISSKLSSCSLSLSLSPLCFFWPKVEQEETRRCCKKKPRTLHSP